MHTITQYNITMNSFFLFHGHRFVGQGDYLSFKGNTWLVPLRSFLKCHSSDDPGQSGLPVTVKSDPCFQGRTDTPPAISIGPTNYFQKNSFFPIHSSTCAMLLYCSTEIKGVVVTCGADVKLHKRHCPGGTATSISL